MLIEMSLYVQFSCFKYKSKKLSFYKMLVLDEMCISLYISLVPSEPQP